jgi:hypothetical protein
MNYVPYEEEEAEFNMYYYQASASPTLLVRSTFRLRLLV